MPIDAKPLSDLFQLGTMLRRRNAIVRAAHAAGVPKAQIAGISGLSRTTVDRILDKPADEDDEGQDDERDPEPSGLIRETDAPAYAGPYLDGVTDEYPEDEP